MIQEPRWHLLSKGCGKESVNIFFAGSGFEYDLAYDVGVRKRLLSWHANTEDDFTQYLDAQKVGRDSFSIIDSGAFSVWNRGGVINLDDYIKKLIEMLPHFDVAANLDVIPGKRGMPARDITTEITEQAAAAGWANYSLIAAALHAEGIDWRRVMSIYHQGESMDWLKRMVDSGCTYIGISPSNDCATPQRQLWLDDVFDYLRTLPEMPKTHGYAVTSPVLMKQFEWFSVDSASWIQLGGFGAVNTPFGIITLTDRQDIMGKADSMGGRNWSKEMKEKVAQYFTNIGLDIETLKTNYRERWKANAIWLLNVEKEMTWSPRPKPTSLFGDVPTMRVSPAKHGREPRLTQDCMGVTLNGKPPLGDKPMHLFDGRDSV